MRWMDGWGGRVDGACGVGGWMGWLDGVDGRMEGVDGWMDEWVGGWVGERRDGVTLE